MFYSTLKVFNHLNKSYRVKIVKICNSVKLWHMMLWAVESNEMYQKIEQEHVKDCQINDITLRGQW